MIQQATITDELTFSQPYDKQEKRILTPEAVEFLTEPVNRFVPARNELSVARQQQWQAIDQGILPNSIPETVSTRDGGWITRSIPTDLQDRRVETTDLVKRKTVINAMNANAKAFMADFEDSLAPDWCKVIDGQINLCDAVSGAISYTNEAGKICQLQLDPAVLICRMRGLHLPEKYITWHSGAIPSSLFDFALYLFHSYQALLAKGSGLYFYLPETQAWQEAAWWSNVFSFTEDCFDLSYGTTKAALLIETLPAMFQMDEILHTLCDHIVGLDYGHWDYTFSCIRTLKNHPDRVLPDRQVMAMDRPFLSAYSRLLVKTYHKRDAFAVGSMAALIPSKDAEHNRQVLSKVTADKELEASNGHDGTWIARPGLADTAMAVLDRVLSDKPSQLSITRGTDALITAKQLLVPCEGERTEAGMRANVRVAVQHVEAWISGNGRVPIHGLMGDTATAEVPRISTRQWTHHQETLDDGTSVTKALFHQWLAEELMVIQEELGEYRFSHGCSSDTA